MNSPQYHRHNSPIEDRKPPGFAIPFAVFFGILFWIAVWHVADKALTQTARDSCEYYCKLELSE